MEINKIISEIKVWDGWAVKYKEFVPKFIEEANNKNTWQEWDKKVFNEFFEKARDQCVSSLQQGYYTNIEKSIIKENWSELAPLLKKIASQQDKLDLDTYTEIKKWLYKYTSQNRKAAVNRLIASLQPDLLCSIVNESSLRILMQKINQLEPEANLKITGNWFLNSNTTLNYFKNKMPSKNSYDIMTYPWQTYEMLTEKKTTTNTNEMSDSNELDTIKELLNYKKQIILQGPPGTGKTRLAKELAKTFVKPSEKIDIQYFKEIVSALKSFKSRINENSIAIESIKNDILYFEGTKSVPKYNFTINDLYDCYTSKDYLGSDFVNYPQYAKRSLVWYVIDGLKKSNMIDQCKLIQFHPSYTYEDFVRGIVAVPSEDGSSIVYEAENKVLGKFAKDAIENYLNSKKDNQTISIEIQVENYFEEFKDYIFDKIEESNGFYELTESVGLISINDNLAFRYKGKNDGWLKNGNRMLFKDILQAYNDGNKVRQDIKKNIKLSGLARQHASYFIRVLNKFQDYIAEKGYTFNDSNYAEIKLKNYVLIIDEINRANLAAVLGELIYALEYRGKSVESIYEIQDNNKIVLPPNLYIIGTMNTADRSVGHIDYAIRRRFAFVDVLPKDLSDEEEEITFDSSLFNSVKELFTTDDYQTHSDYLSTDFEPKDVALGHSYFIDKTRVGGSMSVRLEYEIKPILREYIKDGILKETAKKVVESLVTTI